MGIEDVSGKARLEGDEGGTNNFIEYRAAP